MRVLLIPLIIAGSVFFQETASKAQNEETRKIVSFVDQVGEQTISTGKAIGLSIAVAKGDQIIHAKGFGLANAELNVPATKDTVFRIGSITKEFTAAAILLLVEDGKIDLDAPITRYLPDYPTQGNSVTVRHLLHHTSGVKDFTRLPNYRPERPLRVTPQQVLERFQKIPLEFKPQTKHRYCNSGYVLLAVIVETVSGKSFQEFVERRLFFKLGMRRTYCDSAARIIDNRASGYSNWGGRLRNAPFISLSQTVGAGNIASNVTDLIIWQRGLMTHRLLRSESLQAMTTKGKLSSGRQFNYGFGVRVTKLGGHDVIRHGGGISGFRADLAYYPDAEITISVLSNTESVNTSKLSDQIARFLLLNNGNANGSPSK